jgi:hypothetical protein
MGKILEFLTVNVATPDLEGALSRWRKLGLTALPPAHMPQPPIEITDVTMPLGPSGAISVIAATGPGSVVNRFLAKGGAGVYSIAVRVDSLAEVMKEWAAAGVEWVLPTPQRLPPNTPAARYIPEKLWINWVKPSSLGGIMLEVFEFGGRIEHH